VSPPTVEALFGLMRVTLGALTLTVALALAIRPPKDAVIVDEPLATAVTNPVALTVAAAVLLELYVVPGFEVTF
jgi:hypothetical protein